MAVSVNTIPSVSVPFTDKEGRISPIWHEFLRSFVAASVDGTIGDADVVSTLTAGNGLTATGTNDVTLAVGQGVGIAVNADDVSVDITGQTSVQGSLDDEVLIADVSDGNNIRKTKLRDVVGLASSFTGAIDNLLLSGNTISTTNTNGDLILSPSGTGDVAIDGDISLTNADHIYWAGGSPTTYSIGGEGGVPYLQGQSGTYKFAATNNGWSMGVGTGSTVVWSDSTGAMTVTGLSLKMADNYLSRYTVAAITASTTQTQGQGALTGDINEISVCANANDTVTLPIALAGKSCLVINNGAQTLQVFPASGDNLGAGADTATTIATTSRKLFVAFNSTDWEPVI